jgi:hypothetical protein
MAGGPWENTPLLDSPEQGTAAPEVVMDNVGNATALWAATGGATGWTVRASHRTPTGVWSMPVVLSGPDASESLEPQVGLEGDRDATAVWSRSIGSVTELELVTRSAVTGKWSPVQVLFPGPSRAVAPQIAINPKGDAVMVWTALGPDGFTVEASVRRPRRTWSKPVSMVTPGSAALSPQVAIDARGAALAVWARDLDGSSRVQAASLPATGTKWSQVKTLSQAGVDALTPQTALDADGDGALAWARFDSQTFVIQGAGYDATGPSLTGLTLPAAGTVGKRLVFSVAPKDVWSAVKSVRWTFGDGSFTGSKLTSHVYAQTGRFTVQVTATDSAGHVRTVKRVVTITAA